MFLEAKHLNMGEVKAFRGLQEGGDPAPLGHALSYMCGVTTQHLTPTFPASFPKRLC